MTTTPPLPPPVQDAVDFGLALPSVRVHYRDLRGVPVMDTIDVDYLLDLPGGECIEVGTHWVDDGQWRLCSALWRTFSNEDETHPLSGWEQVREFLTKHTASHNHSNDEENPHAHV